ncbi:MAG: hypothetical protein GEU99_12840 [Luteitalea sp.]|nr:hypothetical protein [Luteitalea sp.]
MTTMTMVRNEDAFLKLMVWTLFLSALLASLMLPGSAAAQALSTIRGAVTDQSGGVVPGVTVTVTDVGTNVLVRTVISNDSGDYEVPDLHPSTYQIRAELSGFRTFVADRVVLDGSQTRRVNVVLQLGEVSDEVLVDAGAAVITTDSGDISAKFTEELFDASPLVNTYYPQSLLTTLAGVESQMGSWSLRMAGQPASQNALGMDGVYQDGTVNLINNMMDFTELTMTAVGNTADQARISSFNMISKSGSNQFRGSLFYTHFNSALNARSFFEPSKLSAREHKSHIDVSGPIVRDRTFFYASYFHQNIPSASFNRSTVATAAMRDGDFSQLLAGPNPTPVIDPLTGAPFPGNVIPPERFNALSALVQEQFIPPPNLEDADTLVNNLGFEHAYPEDLYRADYPMVRIDHQISTNNTLYGRFIQRYTPYVLKRGLPGFDWTRVRWHRGTVFSDTHVFSPNLVATFRAGWLWDFVEDGTEVDGFTPRRGDQVVQEIGLQGVNPRELQAMGFPRMDITGMTSLETIAGGVKEDNHQLSLSNSLTWSQGRHVWKFGGEVRRVSRFDGAISEPTYGRFAFNGRFTGSAYADFLLGLPHSSERVDPLTDRSQVAYELGFFAMDTYKITSRLTLDYGLRWDIFTSPRFDDGLQFNWDPATGDVIVPPDAMSSVSPLYPQNINVRSGDVIPEIKWSNIRPRLAVAYRLQDNLVVRGSYGVFTEQIGYFDRLQGSGPFQIAETYINELVDGKPSFTFPNPFPADIASAEIPSQSIRGFPATTRQGAIHQFQVSAERQFGGLGARLSYIGSRSRGLNYNLNINKPEPGLESFSQDRRPYPQFIDATIAQENGASNYDALQVQVNRRAGPVTFDAHYTLQSNRSNFLNLENPYAPNEWHDEQYNTRHKAAVSTVIELPWGRGRPYLADAPSLVNSLIGDWNVVTVSYVQTGQHFSPAFSGSDPSNTNTLGGLPDRICDGNLPRGQRTVEQWFDPSCFVVPPAARFGNAGANILEGPGLNLHHLSLVKRFALQRGITLEYVAGVSNLFNTPQFGFPRGDINAANPGEITSIRTGRENSGPRMMEMTLRLRW